MFGLDVKSAEVAVAVGARGNAYWLQEGDWEADFARSLALLISGEAGIYHRTPLGQAEPAPAQKAGQVFGLVGDRTETNTQKFHGRDRITAF